MHLRSTTALAGLLVWAALPAAAQDQALIDAAKAEGTLNTIALPQDWCNYGGVIEGFKAKYGLEVKELNPDAGSADELGEQLGRTRLPRQRDGRPWRRRIAGQCRGRTPALVRRCRCPILGDVSGRCSAGGIAVRPAARNPWRIWLCTGGSASGRGELLHGACLRSAARSRQASGIGGVDGSAGPMCGPTGRNASRSPRCRS